MPLRPTVQSSRGSNDTVSGVNGSDDVNPLSCFTSISLKRNRSGNPVAGSVLKWFTNHWDGQKNPQQPPVPSGRCMGKFSASPKLPLAPPDPSFTDICALNIDSLLFLVSGLKLSP